MSFFNPVNLVSAATLGGSGLLSTAFAGANVLADMYTNQKNRETQEDINAANIQMQREINAQNIQMQREVNDRNIAAQREINQSQLDYARSMTQAQWERDDNAHQREVSDLVAAGLSPLANTAGSQVSSAASYSPQSQAVAQAARAEAAQARPYYAQAPQFDVNALMESFRLAEQVREHDDKMIREDRGLELQGEKLTLDSRNLDIKDKEVAASVSKICNDYNIASQQIGIAIRQLDQTKDLEEKKLQEQHIQHLDRMVNEALRDAVKDGLETYPVFDVKEYEVALENWGREFQIFIDTKLSKEGSVQHARGKNGGAGVDVLKVGVKANSGDFQSDSASVNSNYEKQLLREFCSSHPKPQYVYRSR